MNEQEVFILIQKHLLDIMPELKTARLSPSDSLKKLGANSIDRAEIIIKTMADLNIKIPLVEFGKAKNIKELIAIFVAKSSQNHAK